MHPLMFVGAALGVALLGKPKAAQATTLGKGAIGTRAGTGTQIISTTAQPSKDPSSSHAPNVDAGKQANQPWYLGPSFQRAESSVATSVLTAGASALGDLFSSQDAGGAEVTDESVALNHDQFMSSSSTLDETYPADDYPYVDQTYDDADYSDYVDDSSASGNALEVIA